jgi:hypothetical protein
MNIQIANFKNFKSQEALTEEFGDKWTYVGRENKSYHLEGNALGNPFKPQQRGVGETLGQYRQWLWQKIQQGDRQVMSELAKLAKQAEAGEEVAIVCWCHPNPCHAEVIKSALESEKVQQIIKEWEARAS